MMNALLRYSAPRLTRSSSRRYLSLHEYVSMNLLKDYGVPVPRGDVSTNPQEARKIAETLGSGEAIVKAQVLAGGRGKGKFGNGYQGGVKLCNTSDEVFSAASSMLGQRLFTKQTGSAGKPCSKVYVCQRVFASHEYYFAILMDRKAQGPVLVGSNQGGMDIEAVAAKSPESIITQPIDVNKGINISEAAQFAKKLGFKGESIDQAADMITKLYKMFKETDSTLVEINPMIECKDGGVMCLDAKVNVDDNADFRQQKLFALRDVSQEDPREVLAAEARLNYIGLDGSIGCLVNGAGLAMATMDIIKLHGGEPANFLDVGGSATVQQVTDAFRIISGDPKVSAILVNIFGGIMRCDIVAQGVVEACKTLELRIPLIVRLQGTKVAEAQKIIQDSKLNIISEGDLDKAAKLAVSMSSPS